MPRSLRPNMHSLVEFTAILVCAALSARAAVPTSRPYVSPEIHPDRTVTFRILAPLAQVVTLEGGWLKPGETLPLVKDSKGLWSVQVGPLNPTVYAYWFNLDGAVVLDEANPFVRLRTANSSVSAVDIPDAAPLPWSVRDVPHGAVEMNWRKSATFGGETRNIWVYLPPGYDDRAKQTYPVLYLLHGAGELYLSWVESGKANLIFDNLLAGGHMKPMIVVMPYTGPSEVAGSTTPPAAGPDAGGRGGPNPTEQAKPGDYLLKEVIPWAEARYRVTPGSKNRAMAGLSAGGALTATTGLSHMDLFSQLGIFSAPVQVFRSRFSELLSDPKAMNAKLDLLWLGVGKSDPVATEGLRGFDAELTKDGIRHTYLETDGAHDFAVWRWCLVQFAPLLFRNGS